MEIDIETDDERWGAELARRVAEIESGRANGVPVELALAALRDKYSKALRDDQETS